MTDGNDIAGEIADHFGRDSVPALFARIASFEEYLATTWQRYKSVILSGEIERSTKQLMGMAVAIAKSNGYMIALQQGQLRAAGLGPEERLEALAVADFFEGFDAFAQALHIDSDIRPRKLEAGDLSHIDKEIDVNVPYVVTSDDATVNEVYGEIRARMGIPFIPNIFKALANQPAMLKAKWESYKAIMGRGRLRPLTKELIAVAVSAVNGCFY